MAEMDPLGYETGSPPLQSVVAGGRIITYRESGEASSPVIVLLHGVGSGAASWGMQFVGLPSRGWRVIGWDAPGYGGSDLLPQDAPTAADYAAALEDFVVALGIGRFVLVGHSMGALIAAAYCHRTGTTHVDKLVLASPTSGYGTASAEVRRARLDGRLADMRELGPVGLAQKRTESVLSPQAPKRAFVHVRAVMQQLRPDGYAKAVGMLGSGDMFAEALHIKVPTLVMCGSADTVTPEESCHRIADSIAGAHYATVPGPGHACYIEAPGPFESVLLRFLEGRA
jgi:pimeloyl-ACP methyl ester carboxylesterase